MTMASIMIHRGRAKVSETGGAEDKWKYTGIKLWSILQKRERVCIM